MPISVSTPYARCSGTSGSKSARGAATTCHHVFRRAGLEELVNLQRDGDKAKVYQVRQVRAVLARYGLTTTEPPEGA